MACHNVESVCCDTGARGFVCCWFVSRAFVVNRLSISVTDPT